METKIINFFGGPGSGKSTCSASLFAKMKNKGEVVELVTEYAKELVWGESLKTLDNQIYVFAKQYHKIWRLLGKVEWIITDSPLLFSCVYGETSDKFKEFVLEEFNKLNNFNILLNRTKPYSKIGRTQDTEEEARKVDDKVSEFMMSQKLPYGIYDGSEEGVEFILKDLLNYEKV